MSITAKELLLIIVAVVVWGLQWVGLVVLCHCDNEGVVAAINGEYCKDPTLAHKLPGPRGHIQCLVADTSWVSDVWRAWLEILSTFHYHHQQNVSIG